MLSSGQVLLFFKDHPQCDCAHVRGFLVPGVLSIDMVGIMLVVIHPFNFLKAEIRLLWVFPKVVGGKAPVTVPVHILSGTLSVNVFAIFLHRTDGHCAGDCKCHASQIVHCVLLISNIFPPSCKDVLGWGGRQSRQTCEVLRQVIPSTS